MLAFRVEESESSLERTSSERCFRETDLDFLLEATSLSTTAIALSSITSSTGLNCFEFESSNSSEAYSSIECLLLPLEECFVNTGTGSSSLVSSTERFFFPVTGISLSSDAPSSEANVDTGCRFSEDEDVNFDRCFFERVLLGESTDSEFTTSKERVKLTTPSVLTAQPVTTQRCLHVRNATPLQNVWLIDLIQQAKATLSPHTNNQSSYSKAKPMRIHVSFSK